MTSSQAPEFKFPDDLEGFWQWDKMHLPRPLSPQTQELYVVGYSTGFTAAMDEFAYPVGFSYTPINYYGYATMPPQPLTRRWRSGWSATRGSCMTCRRGQNRTNVCRVFPLGRSMPGAGCGRCGTRSRRALR